MTFSQHYIKGSGFTGPYRHLSPLRQASVDKRSTGIIFARTGFIISVISLFVVMIMLVLATPVQAQTPAAAIGQVETLKGTATAIRINNTVLQLTIGDKIFSGDTVKTGPDSSLGITFLDRTVFSLAANAQMVINDLVYNPQGSGNTMAVNLLEGTFVFLAGRIAAAGAMKIDTPVAQIGIRGTLPWITVGAATSFAILSEPDGKTGEYFLLRKGTNTIIGTVNLATVGTTRKLVMNSPADTPRTEDKTPEELAAEQRFKAQIFNTLKVRDARLGITPDQDKNGNQVPPPPPPPPPPPGDQGGNNPPPGTQGSNPALIDQANAVIAACTQAQTKINQALQRYYQGNNRQSRQLLQEARDDLSRLPPESCATLLDRIASGQQTIDQAEEAGRNVRPAINSCNEDEINRLRNRFASSRQNGARAILARLDSAAKKCADRRTQRARVEEKSRANAECRRLNGSGYYAGKVRGDGSFSCRPARRTANAWCRNKNGRGSVAGRIRANGSFDCRYSRAERSRQAWAACRRKYGNDLADVRIFKSGRYRCIARTIVRRDPPQQYHNPVTSAAVIGGILGAIDGLGNRHKKRRSRRSNEEYTPPRHRQRSGPCTTRTHNRNNSSTYLRPCR